ncbi:MAG: TetR/AcrR family transcriptional regulator [Bacillota bacterium]
MPDQPKQNRRERKKKEYRDKIVAAAVKLFDRRGFDATSVADIMNEADLGTGTFYNYFQSKEDVVGLLLRERLEKLRREIAALVEAPGDSREKVRRLFQIVGNSFADGQQARVVILLLQGKKLPTTGISGHAAVFQDLVRELVARAQAKGEFRPDIDAGRISSFLLGVLMYTVRQYLRCITKDCGPGAAGHFQEVLSDNVKLALDGIIN